MLPLLTLNQCILEYLEGLDVDTELATEARTKLLSQGGSESTSSKDVEEGEAVVTSTDIELTDEEDAALEALEAKEFVQYVLELL
jgi:beta-catenin-like protein 1